MRLFVRLAFLASLSASSGPLAAQAASPFDRGPYDPAVPRPDSLLGYALGDRHTQYDRQQWVLDRLAAAAPDRVRTETFGVTVEGRPMRLRVISSPRNLARLDQIRAGLTALADPRQTSTAAADSLAATLPVVVILSHSIHGDEPGGFESAMQTAYQLLAGNDPVTLAILDSVVVLLNPSQNPDGHERFAVWSNSVAVGSAEPGAVEQRAPWEVVGRFNHYRFDMNRDAMTLSQPESRALADVVVGWHPQVFVDLHSTTPQYFFPPAALPINANLPPSTVAWLERFGRGNAAAFDRFGWQYYVRDVFDLFYAGYWDSWPSLHGATGMTYETDGGPELRLRRRDGSVATFTDGILHHFVASMATLETAAAHRTALLHDYYRFRVSGIERARRQAIRRVVVLEQPDPEGALRVAQLLARQGIEVRRAAGSVRTTDARAYLDGTSPGTSAFPAGSYVIDLAQPQARLATALLEPDPVLDSSFVARQLARFERNRVRGESASREGYQFYDVTAWAVPLTYGVRAYWTADQSPFDGELIDAGSQLPAPAPVERAQSAYVVANDGQAATRLILGLLDEEFTVGVATEALRADGQSHAAGSYVLRVQRNPETLHHRIAELARTLGATVTPVQSAFADSGSVGVGSSSVVPVRTPRILLAAGDGVWHTEFGDFWYYLESELGYPVTPVRLGDLGRVELERFNVLVLPGGSAPTMWRQLGTSAAERVRRWVRSGGVVLAVGNAVSLLAREEFELTTVRATSKDEDRVERDTTLSAESAPAPPLVSPTAGAGQAPEYVPGAIFRATLDQTHWLTLGYRDPQLAVPLQTSRLLLPSEEGDNPVAFVGDSLRIAGFVWPDTEDHLQGSVWTAVENHGRGTVVLFASNPLFRGFWRSTARLVSNAMLFGTGR